MNALSIIFSAFFQHAILAFKLKHDGTGMPKEMPGAFLLALAYIALSLINNRHAEGIDMSTFIIVGFVSQCYVLFLRNKLIGLIIFISILCNSISLIMTTMLDLALEDLGLFIVAEYVFVTAAIINVIKSETTAI